MRSRYALLLMGLSFIYPVSIPVRAQESFPALSSEDDTTLSQGARGGVFVWCSAANSERRELYISDVKRQPSGSGMAVNSLSGHFAQTMNARFGIHLAMNAQHCHMFRNSAAAQNARMILMAGARKSDLTVKNAGIF